MKLRAESIGMHDSGGFVCGDCNEFEEVACGVGADHEESLLAVVLVLDVPEGVLPSAGDRSVIESVLPCRRGDLHTRKPYLYTHEIVKAAFTVGAGAQVLGATTGGRTTRAKCRSSMAFAEAVDQGRPLAIPEQEWMVVGLPGILQRPGTAEHPESLGAMVKIANGMREAGVVLTLPATTRRRL